MKKQQYLGEVTIKSGQPLKPYVEEVARRCKEETKSNEIELHQIVTVNETRFLIILNYYI